MVDLLGISSAIVQGITTLIEIHKVDRWARLVFSMIFSGVTSYLTAAGAALIAHRPLLEARGEGFIMAAVAMTYLFRTSDLTKGTTVALPEKEAESELATDMQVINRK